LAAYSLPFTYSALCFQDFCSSVTMPAVQTAVLLRLRTVSCIYLPAFTGCLAQPCPALQTLLCTCIAAGRWRTETWAASCRFHLSTKFLFLSAYACGARVDARRFAFARSSLYPYSSMWTYLSFCLPVLFPLPCYYYTALLPLHTVLLGFVHAGSCYLPRSPYLSLLVHACLRPIYIATPGFRLPLLPSHSLSWPCSLSCHAV